MQKRINKEEWISMFRDIGISDEAKTKWHHLFETRHPESHEEFLAWLGIPADEISKIRAKSC